MSDHPGNGPAVRIHSDYSTNDAATAATAAFGGGSGRRLLAFKNELTSILQVKSDDCAAKNTRGEPHEVCTTSRNLCGKGKDHTFTLVQPLGTEQVL